MSPIQTLILFRSRMSNNKLQLNESNTPTKLFLLFNSIYVWRTKYFVVTIKDIYLMDVGRTKEK